MRQISRIRLAAAVLLLGGLPLAGCGGGSANHIKVPGQVLQNGQPYKLADGEEMTVALNSTSAKGGASATVTQDGSFELVTEPLPPGAYVVNVTSQLNGPNTPSTERYQDKFKGAFSGPNNPLKFDIGPEAPKSLEIDVGKKTVTKK